MQSVVASQVSRESIAAFYERRIDSVLRTSEQRKRRIRSQCQTAARLEEAIGKLRLCRDQEPGVVSSIMTLLKSLKNEGP